MPNRQELEILDDDVTYVFPVAPQEEGGKLFTVQVQEWEPNDGAIPFRTALHPWTGGLGPNRIRPNITMSGNLENRPSMVYAKASADLSSGTYLSPPPKLKHFNTESEVSYETFNEPIELAYHTFQYHGTTYTGTLPQALSFFLSIRNFANKAYFAGGQYIYSVNYNLEFSLVKDFGIASDIRDIEVFNNELVIAMGPAEKIWTMDTNEVFNQATEEVYADALGRDEDKLWRANHNLLSNCITAPRTLTSWVPDAGNEYPVGDTTYPVTGIREALGTIAVFKPDGVYFADHRTRFNNQTPQLARYPDIANGWGAFMAWGYLFVPSIVGLLRVDIGESVVVGPELSNRPDYRFRVHAGVEWNRNIYVLCTDQAHIEQTFVCKIMRQTSELEGAPYIYHEYRRLEDALEGQILTVYTHPENPIMVTGHGSKLCWWHMGRGSGLDIDDPNYEFEESFELETGKIIAINDLGMQVDIEGVKVVGHQPPHSTISVGVKLDDAPTYTDLLSNQSGTGIAPIHTSGYFSENRYAAPNSIGNSVEVKLHGTLPPDAHYKNRTEIDEAWLFGTAHPEVVDILTVGVLTDRNTRVRGLRTGRGPDDTLSLLKSLQYSKRIFNIRIPEYYENQLIKARIVDIEQSNVDFSQQGRQHVTSSVIKVVFRRVDFGENR